MKIDVYHKLCVHSATTIEVDGIPLLSCILWCARDTKEYQIAVERTVHNNVALVTQKDKTKYIQLISKQHFRFQVRGTHIILFSFLYVVRCCLCLPASLVDSLIIINVYEREIHLWECLKFELKKKTISNPQSLSADQCNSQVSSYVIQLIQIFHYCASCELFELQVQW